MAGSGPRSQEWRLEVHPSQTCSTLPRPRRLAIAAFSLSTAGAVLVFLVSRLSLRLSAGLTVAITGAAAGVTWHRIDLPVRRAVSARLKAGALAGLIATAVYDVSRLALAQAASSIQPFEAIRLFGKLLVGGGAPPRVVAVVGVAFHITNGIGLGAAFTILLGGRGWRAGVLYACGLEAVMVLLYPSWLRIQALGEFAAVTLVAHVAYGLTLAETARRLLRQPEQARERS